MAKYLSLLLFIALAGTLEAREPAHVRLHCNSLRFETGTAGPGLGATLQLTTDSAFTELNQEVRPLRNPTLPSHGALFILEDPAFLERIAGQIAFDQPDPADANGNGFDDFFEVSQGVAAARVQGLFTTAVDSGTVSATWSRAAGSSRGTCRLQLTGQVFGTLPEFTHTFELLEYTGTLTYIPGTNSVIGSLELARTGNSSETLAGPVTFTRVSTNRFNHLLLSPGTLTNAVDQRWSFLPGELERDLFSKTNYFGFLDFEDGEPATSTPDYQEWVLSIDDENDADANGIPDLSDDPSALPPRPPAVSLVRSNGQLLLSISGDPGTAYEIEETGSLPPSSWATAASVTLTNSPQTVEIPLPVTPTKFWRARTR